MAGISEELERYSGVKRARRNTVDESNEEEWGKLNSWALQTSQLTSVTHGALECFVSGLLLVVYTPFTFVLSTFQSALSGSRLLHRPPPAPRRGSMLVPAKMGGERGGKQGATQ